MKNMLAIFAVIFIVGFPNAETIYLNDASIIKGKISGDTGNTLVIDTLHGVLKINKTDIKSVEGSLKTIHLKDGTVLKGNIECLEKEVLEINTKHGAVKVDPQKITLIEFDSENALSLPVERQEKTQKNAFKKVRFFLHIEGFAPNTADDGWKKYLDSQVDQLAPGAIGSYEIDSKFALGARFGVMMYAGNYTYTGISVGYICGPNTTFEMIASDGTNADKTETSIKRQMIRAMVEVKKHLQLADNLDFVLGAGMGMAFGRQNVEDWSVDTSDFFVARSSTKKDYRVFTWEANLGFIIKHASTNTETHIGIRYIGMPEISTYKDISGDILIPKMQWNTLGAYIGFGF